MHASHLILFFSAIPIGVVAVVFGGTMFLSLPLFQILFPEMTLGAIVGNIKCGSLPRNVASLHPLRKSIHMKGVLWISVAFIVGGILGARSIAHLSQAFVLPTIIAAFFVTEYASWIQKHIPSKAIILVALVVGFYGGIIGAGIFLLVIALLRLHYPRDDQITTVRADGLLLEGLLNIGAIAVLAYEGFIDIQIALVWAAGSTLGGYIGGHLIVKTGKCSQPMQQWMLRAMFLVALAIAVWKFV